MKALRRFLIALILLYGLVLVAMYTQQRALMYFPSNDGIQPADRGLRNVQVEKLATPDGETLELWYSKARRGQPTVLFLHGNAGEIGKRPNRYLAYQQAGFGVAFLSWRGFGGSTGSPTEDGLILDAVTAYDWVIEQGVQPDDLFIIGESLGTGPAVQLAALRPNAGLILGAPYASTVEIAAGQYPWLPVRLLMKDQYRSIEHIPAVTSPILILHGTEDRVIPFASGQKLFEAAGQNATLRTIDGATHDMLFSPAHWAREIAFIRDLR